jgi:hypothetical protein
MIDSGRFALNAARQEQHARHPLVRFHRASPVWGNTARARRQGYTLGSQPFVTWIDDDDALLDLTWLPQALRILRDDSSVAAVYPRWRCSGAYEFTVPVHRWSLRNAHCANTPYAHHLTVMRRENVTQFFRDLGARTLVRDQDALLVHAQARHGRLVALPALAYHWRLRPGSGRTVAEPPEVDAWVQRYRADTIARVGLRERRAALAADSTTHIAPIEPHTAEVA